MGKSEMQNIVLETGIHPYSSLKLVEEIHAEIFRSQAKAETQTALCF
jgi:hypothetical protein